MIVSSPRGTLFDSGCVSTDDVKQVTFDVTIADNPINVQVIGGCADCGSTAWQFSINCHSGGTISPTYGSCECAPPACYYVYYYNWVTGEGFYSNQVCCDNYLEGWQCLDFNQAIYIRVLGDCANGESGLCQDSGKCLDFSTPSSGSALTRKHDFVFCNLSQNGISVV